MSATKNIAASAQHQSAGGEINQEDGPPGSGGWKAHAEDMERERDHWRQRAQTMLEHQRGEVWYWQGDGNDHPESMVNSLPVVIRADQLRALIAGGVQALSAAPGMECSSREKLREMRHYLAEAHGFAAMSPRGQENIAYALEILDELENLTPLHSVSKAAPGEPFDECFPGEPRVAVPQGLISAACFAIRNKRDGGKVLEQLRRYSVGDLSQLLAPQQEAQEPVALHQVYRCKIKSRKQIDKEIPRESQGWWADVAAGQKLLLRQAVQSDLDRCHLGGKRSKDPNDYMCETQTNGSLVSKVALEYMNPEQNVFASTAPQPAPAPLSRDQIREVFMAHGFTIKEGQTDLKQYVYDAAHALLELVAAPQQEAQEPCPSCKNSDIYACTCTFQTSRNAAPNPSPLSNDVFQKTWRLLDELEKLRSANRDEEDWGTLNKRDNELRAALAAQGGE